jgi:hypothetical protein
MEWHRRGRLVLGMTDWFDVSVLGEVPDRFSDRESAGSDEGVDGGPAPSARPAPPPANVVDDSH